MKNAESAQFTPSSSLLTEKRNIDDHHRNANINDRDHPVPCPRLTVPKKSLLQCWLDLRLNNLPRNCISTRFLRKSPVDKFPSNLIAISLITNIFNNKNQLASNHIAIDLITNIFNNKNQIPKQSHCNLFDYKYFLSQQHVVQASLEMNQIRKRKKFLLIGNVDQKVKHWVYHFQSARW